MSEPQPNFEARLARLDEIVAKIEGETLPLEESMKLFEEGRKLIASLQKDLKDAEEKVEEFLKEDEGN